MHSLAFAQSGGARHVFSDGQLLYLKGDYAKAARVFAKNLEKYPGHEPSVLFLGKSLYRLSKTEDAWKAFRNVSESSLDSESKYEYGYTAYRNKAWQQATDALSKVPEANQNYDLAMYYLSVSLINLDRLADAQSAMKKAVVLPPRFLGSRKGILNYLRTELAEKDGIRNQNQIRIQTREKNISSNNNIPNNNLPNPNLKDTPSKSDNPKNEPNTFNEPVEHSTNSPKKLHTIKPDTGAEVLYVEENEYEDLRLDPVQLQDGPERSYGTFISAEGLLLTRGGNDRDRRLVSKAGVFLHGTSESKQDGWCYWLQYQLRSATFNPYGAGDRTGLSQFESVDMWESAIPGLYSGGTRREFWGLLKLGLKYKSFLGSSYIYGGAKGLELDNLHRSNLLGAKLDFLSGRLIGSLGGEVNEWQGPVYQKIRSSSGYMKGLFPFQGNLTLGVSLSKHVLEQPSVIIEHPLGLSQLELSAEQNFASRFKLKGLASFMGFENHLRGNLNEGTIIADGMRLSAGLSVEWNPLKWLRISAKQMNSSLKWSNINPADKKVAWSSKVAKQEEFSSVEVQIYRPF